VRSTHSYPVIGIVLLTTNAGIAQDTDGVIDVNDNAPTLYNPNQLNSDGDPSVP